MTALAEVFRSDSKSPVSREVVENRTEILFIGGTKRRDAALVAGSLSKPRAASLLKKSASRAKKSVPLVERDIFAPPTLWQRIDKPATQSGAAIIMAIAGAVLSAAIGWHGVAIAAIASAVFFALSMIFNQSSNDQRTSNILSNIRDSFIFLWGCAGSFALGAGAFDIISTITKFIARLI